MPVLGVDVSHYQGIVDWDRVASSAVRFAICKATDGADGVDERFAENWRELGRTPLIRGAYHFANPGGPGSAEAQAEHFAAVVGDCTGPHVLPPALDLEIEGSIPIADVVPWVRAFVSRAEALFKRELMIYTGGFWRGPLRDPIVPELGTRMLWTARYGTQQPVVPRTWPRWDFWQFSDGVSGDVQVIPGIKGPVDADRFRGDLPELQQLATWGG